MSWCSAAMSLVLAVKPTHARSTSMPYSARSTWNVSVGSQFFGYGTPFCSTVPSERAIPWSSVTSRTPRPVPRMPPPQKGGLTMTDTLFLSRMEVDIEERRRTAFIDQLRKDPRFKPSMLEPPKPKFQTVTLTGGPIIKTHKSYKTGLEPKRPYQWGPLGGYY